MSSRIGINLRVTGHCHQGGRKYMEDAFVVAYQQTENEKDLEYAYFGIFDGHGGKEASLFAKEHLMDNIVNQKYFWSDSDELVLKAIKDGFRITHQAMWKELGSWPKTVYGLPSTSGTTASIAFIRQGKMYVGHVGDSRIVLGYQEPGIDKWQPKSLTRDHKPESPSEKERIYSAGGRVMNKAGVERVVWNRPQIGHRGPVRRSTHFDLIPFLAVARSLGDLWSYNYSEGEFIVSPEPDVCVVTLDPKKDRCIVLASDGLWNMLPLKEAVMIVQEVEVANEKTILDAPGSKPATNPSKLLVDRALSYWSNLKMRADNTSVVTVLMDPPGPPKREVLLRQKVMQKLRPREEQSDCDSGGGSHSESEISEERNRRKSFSGLKLDDFKEKRRQLFGDIRPTVLPKPVVLTPCRMLTKPVYPRPLTCPQYTPKEVVPNSKNIVPPETKNSSSVLKDIQGVKTEAESESSKCEIIKVTDQFPEGDENSRSVTNEGSKATVVDVLCKVPNSDNNLPQTISASVQKCGGGLDKTPGKAFTRLKRKLGDGCVRQDSTRKLKSRRILNAAVTNYCCTKTNQHSLTQYARTKFRTARVKEP